MAKRVLIYGATGFTGGLIAARALAQGLTPILAGRNAAKLNKLANDLGAEARVLELEDRGALLESVADAACVIHAAGPFVQTAKQMLDACCEVGVHYLDITGELNVFSLAQSLSDRASQAGIMLLPGAGWDVVPSDCLALHTVGRVSKPQTLSIALKHFGGVSRGSVKTMNLIGSEGLWVRRDGALVQSAVSQPRDFDFGDGAVSCVPISSPDLITAWHATSIANIEVYAHFAPDAFEGLDVATMPDGPSEAERRAGTSKVAAQVTGAGGETVSSYMWTASGYDYTAFSVVEIARRVLDGDFRVGFQSPASAYGVSLATSVGDGRIWDIP